MADENMVNFLQEDNIVLKYLKSTQLVTFLHKHNFKLSVGLGLLSFSTA